MKIKILFSIIAALFLFVGCNKPQWHATEQDVLVYTQMKSGTTCVWDGGTMLALAHGPGTLTVYSKSGSVVESKSVTADMGIIGESRYSSVENGYFLGELKKDKPNGFGVFRSEGVFKIGSFKKGKLAEGDENFLMGNVCIGYETETGGVPIYWGQMKKGKPHGFGDEYKDGMLRYHGSWHKGEWSGLGVEYILDSAEYGVYYVYDGAFSHDVQKGEGKLFKYQIQCGNGLDTSVLDSTSILQKADSPQCDTLQMLLYNGEWKDGMRHGVGVEYNERGIVVYEGSWKKDMYDGKGTLYKEGKCIEGRFDEGRLEKEFKVSVMDQVKRTTNQLLGKEVFDEQEASAEESIATPESSVASSKMEFIKSMMPELEEYAKEKIDKRVDKRFGFWNIVRMATQPVFRKELKRMDKAQKYFCKDLTPNTIEKWINAKVDYYNQSHEDKLGSVSLEKIGKNQIVTSEVAKKVFARENREIGGFLAGILISLLVVFVLTAIAIVIMFALEVEEVWIAIIVDVAIAVIAFLVSIGVDIFVNGPICTALENEIKQMVLENYMAYINSQDIIAQMIGML